MRDARSIDLEAAGLVRDGPCIRHFGDAKAEALAALTGNAVFDLQHLALIAVKGDDAEAFLQGQLTNDVREVTAARAQQSAWCSTKGRVLTCFLVFRHNHQLLLQLPESLVAPLVKRMRMYVLRAKTSLADSSALSMRMGLIGEDAEARLKERFGPVPDDADDVCSAEDVTIIRVRGRRPRFEIVGPREDLASLWNACRQFAAAAGADAWELLDIEAGVASIGPVTSDIFVPQMINLDRIDAVSFTKGCYVGQEIVARTQHLGRIKRRMYRAHVSGSAPVDAGDTLKIGAESTLIRVQVVNAKPAPAGGFDVLAVIAIEDADNMTGRGLDIGHGSRFTLKDLPYVLEDEIA